MRRLQAIHTTYASAVLLALVLSRPPAIAADTCAEHYSEKGDRANGKSFTSYIDVKDTSPDTVYLAIGRHLAKEGYIGIAVNKELGLVSGSKSKWAVNVTVSPASPGTLRVEVVARLEPGSTAVTGMRGWLCDLLAQALSTTDRERSQKAAAVVLRSPGTDLQLSVVEGLFRKTVVPFVDHMMFYYDYAGEKAEQRTSDRRPSIVVRRDGDPAKAFVLVKCETDNGKRTIKVKGTTNLAKQGFSTVGDLEPDEDWIISTTTIADTEPGQWRFVPSKELKHGEYALWDVQAYRVALFGVD